MKGVGGLARPVVYLRPGNAADVSADKRRVLGPYGRPEVEGLL